MKTVELSAALNSAQVVENLKNFVGVDAQGAAALMTPERLAAVAGGLAHNIGDSFYTCSIVGVEGNFDNPIKIAEEILAVLPQKRVSFMCIHAKDGIRVVRGLIYESHDYGIFFIEDHNGNIKKVVLNNFQLSVSL